MLGKDGGGGELEDGEGEEGELDGARCQKKFASVNVTEYSDVKGLNSTLIEILRQYCAVMILTVMKGECNDPLSLLALPRNP